MSACDLCGEQIDGGTRTCGADLCDVCYGGHLIERVRQTGLELDANWKRSSSRDGHGGRDHTIRKTVSGIVRLSNPTPVVTFRREGVGIRLRKFFGVGPDDVKLGDAAFDHAVLVDTETPELTREALANGGLRDVVMESVAAFGGLAFDTEPGGARVTILSVEHPQRWSQPREGQQRLVAIALMHLRRRFG